MRYLVTSQRRVLAVVGFGASAWKAAPRDRFIGWSVAQREARLQLVVNNARFLILPWVQVRNLASTVLARSSRRLPDDWQARYGYRPLLLETFVQSDRSSASVPLPSVPPRRQLDPCRSDPRPRQTRRASYPRAAQERHLALPAQARLPPPTLRPSQSSPQPVERIFTAGRAAATRRRITLAEALKMFPNDRKAERWVVALISTVTVRCRGRRGRRRGGR